MAAKRKYLTFNTSEVAPLVKEAKEATSRRCTFEQMFDPSLHKGGKIKNVREGCPDVKNIDLSKVLPSLWLVKDEGCYLMSNSIIPAGQKNANVAYAHESNPKTMDVDKWYGNARYIMGGSDCALALPIEWFDEVVASGKATFRLQILAKSIKLVL